MQVDKPDSDELVAGIVRSLEASPRISQTHVAVARILARQAVRGRRLALSRLMSYVDSILAVRVAGRRNSTILQLQASSRGDRRPSETPSEGRPPLGSAPPGGHFGSHRYDSHPLDDSSSAKDDEVNQQGNEALTGHVGASGAGTEGGPSGRERSEQRTAVARGRAVALPGTDEDGFTSARPTYELPSPEGVTLRIIREAPPTGLPLRIDPRHLELAAASGKTRAQSEVRADLQSVSNWSRRRLFQASRRAGCVEADVLKAWLLIHSLSDEEAARLLGCGTQTVMLIRTGRRSHLPAWCSPAFETLRLRNPRVLLADEAYVPSRAVVEVELRPAIRDRRHLERANCWGLDPRELECWRVWTPEQIRRRQLLWKWWKNPDQALTEDERQELTDLQRFASDVAQGCRVRHTKSGLEVTEVFHRSFGVNRDLAEQMLGRIVSAWRNRGTARVAPEMDGETVNSRYLKSLALSTADTSGVAGSSSTPSTPGKSAATKT